MQTDAQAIISMAERIPLKRMYHMIYTQTRNIYQILSHNITYQRQNICPQSISTFYNVCSKHVFTTKTTITIAALFLIIQIRKKTNSSRLETKIITELTVFPSPHHACKICSASIPAVQASTTRLQHTLHKTVNRRWSCRECSAFVSTTLQRHQQNRTKCLFKYSPTTLNETITKEVYPHCFKTISILPMSFPLLYSVLYKLFLSPPPQCLHNSTQFLFTRKRKNASRLFAFFFSRASSSHIRHGRGIGSERHGSLLVYWLWLLQTIKKFFFLLFTVTKHERASILRFVNRN